MSLKRQVESTVQNGLGLVNKGIDFALDNPAITLVVAGFFVTKNLKVGKFFNYKRK